jgi:hypothetical protein
MANNFVAWSLGMQIGHQNSMFVISIADWPLYFEACYTLRFAIRPTALSMLLQTCPCDLSTRLSLKNGQACNQTSRLVIRQAGLLFHGHAAAYKT